MTIKLKSRIVGTIVLLACLSACAGAPRDVRPDPDLRCSAERTDDRGMGGTGVIAFNNDDRGIGGTGIIGTVTGFGSICVNGFKVTYDPSLPNANTLERGMTVAVTTAQVSGQLKANSIDIIHTIVGPVTARVDSAGMLKVMGVPVNGLDATGTAAAALQVDDVVAVDGLQRADGTIDATRIAPAPSGGTALVRGVVDRAGTPVRVGGIAMPGLADQPLPDGAWALVAGRWAGGVFTPERVVVGSELTGTASGRLSIEGYLVLRSDGRYAVRGLALAENAERGLDRTIFARLAAGQRVQVLGRTTADGSLRADTVIVPRRLNPLGDSTRAPTASEEQPRRGIYGATRPNTPTDVPTITRSDTITRPLIRPETRPIIRPEIPGAPAPRPGR